MNFVHEVGWLKGLRVKEAKVITYFFVIEIMCWPHSEDLDCETSALSLHHI